jgi:hypothetical protein
MIIRFFGMVFVGFCFHLYGMYEDNHFYRAAALWSEPRFDRDWLSTVECTVGKGSADYFLSKKSYKVPLEHTFSLVEANLWYLQNIINGFFTDFYIPIRSIEVRQKRALKACNHCFIPIKPQEITGIGDCIVHIGYTYSYQNTSYLDFIDGTLRLGILLPTSGHTVASQGVLPIVIGYNGLTGFPISADISCGAYQWLTGALHAAIMPLIDIQSNKHIRTKTGKKITKNIPNVSFLYAIGFLIKADHIMRGISGTLGYSYIQQAIDPCANNIIHSFTIHTLHIQIEYDLLRQEYWLGPRISLLYNYILSGTSIIQTNMLYGQCALDIAWDF